jgi:hypothetical protein
MAMTFRKWLKTIDAESESTSDDVGMIAGDAASGVLPDLLDLHDFERWYREQGANDEVVEAVRVAWLAFVEATGASSVPTPPDPMGQPYTPGARTTLADARLQLVCAVFASGLVPLDMGDVNEPAKLADDILKAMKG